MLFVHLFALHRFLLVALDILRLAVRDVEIQPADRGGGLLPAAAEDQVQAQHERQAQQRNDEIFVFLRGGLSARILGLT